MNAAKSNTQLINQTESVAKKIPLSKPINQ